MLLGRLTIVDHSLTSGSADLSCTLLVTRFFFFLDHSTNSVSYFAFLVQSVLLYCNDCSLRVTCTFTGTSCDVFCTKKLFSIRIYIVKRIQFKRNGVMMIVGHRHKYCRYNPVIAMKLY